MVKKTAIPTRNRPEYRSAMVVIDHEQLDRLEAYMAKELPPGMVVPLSSKVRMAMERFLKSVGA